MCQFETLEAVRKNIISKVRGRFKKDPELGKRVSEKIQNYKADASKDMSEWNSHLKKKHDDLKPKGKRKKSKDRKGKKSKDRKRKKSSSSSSDSSSESQKKKKKTEKSDDEEKEESDDDDEDEKDPETVTESGSHRDSSTLSLPGTGGDAKKGKGKGIGDEDLWSNAKFTRSSSQNQKMSLQMPDDDLQEMLGEVLNEHFKQESESWMKLWLF